MGPGSFGSVLEANYHARIPFFDGTVAEAQRLAQEAAQFLVVYLHCPTHEDSSDFITKVLGQEEVVAQLTQSAVLVGISVAEWEGHQLAQQLSITTYPAVAVYLKRELVMRTMGLCTKEDFLLDWRAMMDVWGGVHAEEIAWRTDREARISSQFTVDAHREEMEETDRRLLAEMEAERQRADARIAEEKLLEEQAAHAKREEEVRAAAEAERQAHELHLRKCRQTEAAQRLPPPPPEDADRSAIVHIALKSITGKTHERTFWRTDSVDALMDLALSLDESCDAVDLVCGFPPAPLTWEVGCTTFSDLRQLCPRAVVQIRRRAK